MSENKKTIILAIVLASLLVIVLGGVSLAFFPAQQTRSASTPNAEPAPLGVPNGGQAIIAVQIFGTVALNSSEGFSSSIIAGGAESSPLFGLPPGGNGSVPFLIYSNGVNETVNVSLSVNLPLQEAESYYGVQFNVSSSNFTLSPGEQVTSVLNVVADQNALSAFYLPTVQIQTNSSYIIGGTVNVLSLLVADSTPSCLFLENEQVFIPPISIAPFPPSVGGINALAGSSPPTVSTPINNASISSPPPVTSPLGTTGLSVAPTIDIVPGVKTTVLYACIAQEPLSLNVTVPAGFTADFSPNPTDIVFSYTSGNIYTLTVTAGATVSSGTYEVNATGSLGSYQFDASCNVVVK